MGKGGGKKQHSKDPMHLTASEWKYEWGGKKDDMGHKFKALPFYCCSISLTPFSDPWAADDGTVFDILNIAPYLKKYKSHPRTGEPLSAKDIFRVNFSKNSDGNYQCPITYKTFTEHSHIVVIKPSGNVYSYEAVEQLNIKAKNWIDLLTSEPFTRKDIITLQDPKNQRDFSQFNHVKKQHTLTDDNNNDPLKNINVNTTTARILSKLEKSEKAKEIVEKEKIDKKNLLPTEPVDASNVMQTQKEKAIYSNGKVAASFTSSAVNIATRNDRVELTKVKAPKKKGYLRLKTNMGDLNIELHCDLVPKTCFNFLRLCETGYYNGVQFHRNIKNFMIQGGDPDGTGRGGKSIWGGKFEDEFKPQLLHNGRGILAMANSGKDTNGSQFYITYKSCPHLNNKHTVFGRVVGGMDTLRIMEQVPADKNERPTHEIKIEMATVFQNPFETMDEDEKEEARKKAEKEKQKNRDLTEVGAWYSNPTNDTGSTEVGRFLKDKKPVEGSLAAASAQKRAAAAPAPAERPAKKPVQARGFDFSTW